jgi:hypothetical protein
MKQFRLSYIAVLCAAIGLSAAPELASVGKTAYAEESMRPEIGRLVQAAGELAKQKKYKDALAKLHDADNVSGKTASESFTIERMRLSVASAASDNDAMLHSLEVIIAANKLPAGEQQKYLLSLGGAYYKANNYSKAVQAYTRYISEGGTDPSAHAYLVQSEYMSGDYARAMKDVQADILAAEKAGHAPSENQLGMYSNCALKLNDKNAYTASLEKLVTYYPKKEYWVDLLNRVQNKPGYSDRLTLDLFRLKFVLGQLSTTSDFMQLSQLALQAGFPDEALKVIDQGYKIGALGTGSEAERHKRLRDLATKNQTESKKNLAQAEKDANDNKDGSALVDLGYAYVSGGQFDKGLALMEKGIAKDNIKHEDDAKLHLGMAYLQAGKKANGLKVLKSIQGKDGTADLAHYWAIYANQPK